MTDIRDKLYFIEQQIQRLQKEKEEIHNKIYNETITINERYNNHHTIEISPIKSEGELCFLIKIENKGMEIASFIVDYKELAEIKIYINDLNNI